MLATLAALQFLIGTWTCSYAQGSQHGTYTATFSYDFGKNWLRQRDSWAGGGGDEGMTAYQPATKTWTEVVMEGEGSTTLFVAHGTDGAHLTYRSVYPDATDTDVFDKVSATEYTLHFSQTKGGKTTRSVDVCRKRV